MGSLASEVEKSAKRLLGKRWGQHKRTINEYWEEITRYFESKNVRGVKIFQDALPAGNKAAQIMIRKLAKTGSPNYRLLKRLVDRGTILQETEDPALLKKEYQLIKDLAIKKGLLLKFFAYLNYKLKKGWLRKARDKYIAKRINQNLGEGETGVCFLGAYHKVLPKLAEDIKIVRFKNPDKVKEYYWNLTKGTKIGKVNDLARYLTSPVKSGLIIVKNQP